MFKTIYNVKNIEFHAECRSVKLEAVRCNLCSLALGFRGEDTDTGT